MSRGLSVLAVALVLATPARAAPPTVDARAFTVVNAADGTVLASSNAHDQLPVASNTTPTTATVPPEHMRPDADVKETAQAAHVGEERIPLHAGQVLSVHDLLEGALIQSANDAADTLAAGASGGNIPLFVEWMNEEAKTLGLTDTHFVRPDGLDAPGHVSSAHDVAVLAQVAMHSPIVRDIVRKRIDSIEDGALVLHTWNDLLGVFPGLIGVKTGHTNDAGWCEVAAARRAGYTIYAVILGSPTRAVRNAGLQSLLAWGVSQYRTLTLVAAQPYAWAAAPFGRRAVPLVARKPLVRAVRVARPIVEKIIAPTAVALPVRRGERLGRVEVWAGGK